MERITGHQIDSFAPDNLIAKLYPPALPFVVALKTPGEYKRGTVLSLENDGTYEILGGGSGAASAVISDNTTETDDVAAAYRSGHFNRNALITAENYTLSAADENNLRLAGILLSDAVPNGGAYADGAAASEEADPLTVTSTAGTAAGKTKLTVSPEKSTGNSYKYKTGSAAETVGQGEPLTTGWSAWNGTAEIEAATGKIITVVECNSENQAVRAGSASVSAKAAA